MGKVSAAQIDRVVGEASSSGRGHVETDQRILVAVRVRPSTQKEREASPTDAVTVLDRRYIVVADRVNDKNDALRGHRSRERKFVFDLALDGRDKQETLYTLTVQNLIPGVLDGYNATVFAYGATGAGKTYTMIGTPTQPGVMVQTLAELFDRIEDGDDPHNEGMEFTVVFSYLEVYNEVIRDLLTPGDVLAVREDPLQGICVPGITEYEAISAEEIMDLLRRGNRNRTQEATGANAYSSRSHAVLQVRIEQRDRSPGVEDTVRIGKLSLVDLAGSERASKTNNRGQRMLEGAKINRSLLALANCINALGDKSNKNQHIPYRDSKLTRLLKDSLGGNCRTTMIANVGPSIISLEETINTLKYASRAKNIQMKIERNVDKVSAAIEQYTAIIANLRQEVASLRNRLTEGGVGGHPSAGPDAMGDADDSEERKMLVRCCASVKHNAHKRMELRRSLIDLEDMQARNATESASLQKTVDAWVAAKHPAGTPEPRAVRAARAEIEAIEANMHKNTELKGSLEARLVLVEARLGKHEAEDARQRSQYSERFKSKDKKALVNAEFRIRALEHMAMEGEEHLLLSEAHCKERLQKIEALSDAVQLRDTVITAQRAVLEEQDIPPSDTLKDAYAKLDAASAEGQGAAKEGKPDRAPKAAATDVGAEGGGEAGDYSPPASPVSPCMHESSSRHSGANVESSNESASSDHSPRQAAEGSSGAHESSAAAQRRTALGLLNKRKGALGLRGVGAIAALSVRAPPRVRHNWRKPDRQRFSLEEQPSPRVVNPRARRQLSARVQSYSGMRMASGASNSGGSERSAGRAGRIGSTSAPRGTIVHRRTRSGDPRPVLLRHAHGQRCVQLWRL